MREQLKQRTKQFSLAIIDMVENMDYSLAKKTVMNQIIRSATSVGANYRAACRARSSREFIAKLNIVLEESDECCFWLEIIKDKKWYRVENELKEANELTSIFVTTLKTMNHKLRIQAKS